MPSMLEFNSRVALSLCKSLVVTEDFTLWYVTKVLKFFW